MIPGCWFFDLIWLFLPSSLTNDRDIPFLKEHDAPCGGQPVLAVGSQMNRYGLNQHAIRIRSSRGRQ